MIKRCMCSEECGESLPVPKDIERLREIYCDVGNVGVVINGHEDVDDVVLDDFGPYLIIEA